MSENKTFSSINLFIDDRFDPDAPELEKILEKYEVLSRKVLNKNLMLDLESKDYDDVLNFLKEILQYLCSKKRSQATVFDDDQVKCVVVNGGELLEQAS